MVKAVVGANWGDEGKGKITDTLADSADVVIRFQGGANAGHTIVNQYGKFALHTLPSGVFHQNVMNIIGNGVALNVPILFKEMQNIIEKGVPAPQLMISDRCQIVMPYHILFDQLEEERLAGKSFGSTKSGIAPFYSDKYAKIGFQVNELFQEESVLAEKIADVCVKKDILLQHLYHTDPIDQKELLETLLTYRDMIAPYVGNVAEYLEQAIKEDKTILLEGQLGTMKDPDHGIYPMVTSSSTLAAYGAIGAGLPPYAQASSHPRSSETRQKSFAEEAVTAASTAQRPEDPEESAGMTAWRPNTAAACRALSTWRSRSWTYWDIWTRSRSVSLMRSTAWRQRNFP